MAVTSRLILSYNAGKRSKKSAASRAGSVPPLYGLKTRIRSSSRLSPTMCFSKSCSEEKDNCAKSANNVPISCTKKSETSAGEGQVGQAWWELYSFLIKD